MPYGGSNIFNLALLGATREQYHQSFSVLAKIDPISGTEINPKLIDAGAALFLFIVGKVASIWLLGDIVSLPAQPQDPEQYGTRFMTEPVRPPAGILVWPQPSSPRTSATGSTTTDDAVTPGLMAAGRVQNQLVPVRAHPVELPA